MSSKEATTAIIDIYEKGKLVWPKKIIVDPGPEFKGELKKEMEERGALVIEASTTRCSTR